MSLLTALLLGTAQPATPPAAPPPAAASAEDKPIAEVQGWLLYDKKGYCAAATLYEGGVYMRLEFDLADDLATLSVSNPAWESVESGREYKITVDFDIDRIYTDAPATGLRSDDGSYKGVMISLTGNEFLADFGRANVAILRMGDTLMGRYNLNGTGAMVRRLARCSGDSFKRYPPDPFKKVASSSARSPAGQVGPARAMANLPSLISDADYPASALRAGEQGTVGFRLGVGANGRVTDCTVTSSSGSAALDATTCRIIQSRARFTPARDGNGNATTDTVNSRITWRLEAEAPPVPATPET